MEAIRIGVHDIDIIVTRVGDVNPGGFVMDRSMIKATFLCMRGKLDIADESETHHVICSNLALPSTLSSPYVQRAS